jgi:hypothetical protein
LVALSARVVQLRGRLRRRSTHTGGSANYENALALISKYVGGHRVSSAALRQEASSRKR